MLRRISAPVRGGWEWALGFPVPLHPLVLPAVGQRAVPFPCPEPPQARVPRLRGLGRGAVAASRGPGDLSQAPLGAGGLATPGYAAQPLRFPPAPLQQAAVGGGSPHGWVLSPRGAPPSPASSSSPAPPQGRGGGAGERQSRACFTSRCCLVARREGSKFAWLSRETVLKQEHGLVI